MGFSGVLYSRIKVLKQEIYFFLMGYYLKLLPLNPYIMLLPDKKYWEILIKY